MHHFRFVREMDIFVDCMGTGGRYAKKREYHSALGKHHQILMNVSWNYPGQATVIQLGMLALLLIANPGAKVVFFCKMGEVRSAGVLGCMLCALHGMTPAAAKQQIEELRPPREGVTADYGLIQQVLPDVKNEIAKQLIEYSAK